MAVGTGWNAYNTFLWSVLKYVKLGEEGLINRKRDISSKAEAIQNG